MERQLSDNSPIRGALDLQALLEQVAIGKVEDIQAAAINFKRIASVRGMHVAVHDDIASHNPMTDANGNSLNKNIFGWATDDWWWDHPRFALYSPVMRACLYTTEPFWCNAQGIYGCSSNKHLEHIDTTTFFSAAKCSVRALIVVPVHLPFGQVSANSFPLFDASLDNLSDHFDEYGLLLGALTRRFISDYVTIASDSNWISSKYSLSNREVDCIKLASLGKTDTQIGTVLSLCRSTVRYHIKSASVKLGAANRTQTAVKAAQLGYLGASSEYSAK